MINNKWRKLSRVSVLVLTVLSITWNRKCDRGGHFIKKINNVITIVNFCNSTTANTMRY